VFWPLLSVHRELQGYMLFSRWRLVRLKFVDEPKAKLAIFR
jgi:hypothetical protein